VKGCTITLFIKPYVRGRYASDAIVDVGYSLPLQFEDGLKWYTQIFQDADQRSVEIERFRRGESLSDFDFERYALTRELNRFTEYLSVW
jgi:hypothetical protein